MTAGDELKKLVQRSGGPTPDGTLKVTVSSEIGWERLACEVGELFDEYEPTDVAAVGIWRDETRLGFVLRESYRQKVSPELGDRTNEMAVTDDASLPGVISGIPPLRRECKYKESGRKCGEPQEFHGVPDVLPPCPNKKGLTPHEFEW